MPTSDATPPQQEEEEDGARENAKHYINL